MFLIYDFLALPYFTTVPFYQIYLNFILLQPHCSFPPFDVMQLETIMFPCFPFSNSILAYNYSSPTFLIIIKYIPQIQINILIPHCLKKKKKTRCYGSALTSSVLRHMLKSIILKCDRNYFFLVKK